MGVGDVYQAFFKAYFYRYDMAFFSSIYRQERDEFL